MVLSNNFRPLCSMAVGVGAQGDPKMGKPQKGKTEDVKGKVDGSKHPLCPAVYVGAEPLCQKQWHLRGQLAAMASLSKPHPNPFFCLDTIL